MRSRMFSLRGKKHAGHSEESGLSRGKGTFWILHSIQNDSTTLFAILLAQLLDLFHAQLQHLLAAAIGRVIIFAPN